MYTSLTSAHPFDALFEALASHSATSGRARQSAPVNVWSDDEQITLSTELPGVGADQVQLTLSADTLQLATNRSTSLPEGAQWHRRERPAGELRRVVSLPYPVDPERINATLKDGVLTVRLTRAASSKPRTIAVQSA